MPDRTDPPREDAQNGVLADTGRVDSAGLGILGGATAQLDVILPGGSDDDVADDDVVGDEVAPGASEVWRDPAEIGEVETLATGEVEVEVEAGDHRQAAPRAEDIVDVEEIESTDAGAAATPSPLADAGLASPAAASLASPAVAAASRRQISASRTGSIPPTTGRVPDRNPTIPPTGTASDPVPSTSSRTDPAPSTRWAAQHPGQANRPDRAHAVERVQTHHEVSLTSKRLGEFDKSQETPDLLTAERLLDRQRVARPEPEGGWQRFVYSISGRRINLGDGKRARQRKELDRRISAPLTGGARFVAVLSRKGGVGKTTTTALLGQALADARDDRVIAIDANPDRGTLAERITRTSGRTVRDLARTRGEVNGYNDISSLVARDETRLDVLASDTDPRVSEALSDRDYHDVAATAAHYYSIVLTDTGTGIVHSVMGATLELADELVIVAGLSVDEARLASETLTWLEINGYEEQVRNAVVVLNTSRPGAPLVREDELVAHFRTRVRAVVRMPYDPHVATGSAIGFRELQPATRHAARMLAASVVEGLRGAPTAA